MRRREEDGGTGASPELALDLSVEGAEIDDLGHVSNIVYVRWIQEVAMAHSASVGLDLSAYRRLGGVFVVRRHEIDYLAPLYAGEKVTLVTFVARFSGATSERHTTIRRTGDGKPVARAVTTWAFVSIPEGRPRRIPAELAAAFGML